MNRHRKFSLLAVAIATAGSVAYAAEGSTKIDALALAITQGKISLAQAVTTAEQHVNGKAARAEYEYSKLGWVYEVEVVNGTKVFDVQIDADKGTVLSSTEDPADRDDDHHDQPD